MPKRLLFVTDVQLLPPDRGMRVRVMNLLSACARTHVVTLVAPPPSTLAERSHVAALCERTVWLATPEEAAERADAGTWWQAFRTATGVRRPGHVRSYLPFVQALAEIDPEAFDLIWAERPHIARVVRAHRARTIMDLDDIDHRRRARAREYQPQPTLRAWFDYHYRYKLYRHLELRWSRGFLATVVCSEEDRAYLQANGVTKAVVVPNAINEASMGPGIPHCHPEASGPLRIAFLGNLLHPPNLDAVEYLGNEILPQLRSAAPDVIVDVLGPSATPALQARFAGLINFRGFVPDLAAALAGYDVLAAPIRFGSGTRVKLLDAMACRIPIVTTRAGAEGLPVVDGQHLVFAESPAEFVAQVLRVKRDPALAAELVRNGAALIDRSFRSSAIQARIAGWLDTLLPPPAAARTA